MIFKPLLDSAWPLMLGFLGGIYAIIGIPITILAEVYVYAKIFRTPFKQSLADSFTANIISGFFGCFIFIASLTLGEYGWVWVYQITTGIWLDDPQTLNLAVISLLMVNFILSILIEFPVIRYRHMKRPIKEVIKATLLANIVSYMIIGILFYFVLGGYLY
jgi:hypothetical protein